MPYWLVTSTFYGQWLPGDERGSITNVRERRPGDESSPARREHDRPGETYEEYLPGLHQAAQNQLKGPPVAIDLAQAEELLDQFLDTAAHRGWVLHAVSIMFNHIHLVVEVPSGIGKSQLLRGLQRLWRRRLNSLFGKRESGTWWSDGGSGRVVRNWQRWFTTCAIASHGHWWFGVAERDGFQWRNRT